MPKFSGVYKDRKGGWYFKIRTKKDPDTGKWSQTTRRGFKSAKEASRKRQEAIAELENTPNAKNQKDISVGGLVEKSLNEAETLGDLSEKTLHDYRQYLACYIKPTIGDVFIGGSATRGFV